MLSRAFISLLTVWVCACGAAPDQPTAEPASGMPEALLLVGDHHFENADGREGLLLAAQAYEQAVLLGPSTVLDLALYKLGWTNYKLGDFSGAIRRFAELLDLYASSSEPGQTNLRDEAIEQIVILLLDEDWDGDGVADQRDGPTRLRDPELLDQASPWLGEVCRRLGEMYGEMGQRELAERVLVTCDQS